MFLKAFLPHKLWQMFVCLSSVLDKNYFPVNVELSIFKRSELET
jgi:hypothetical protein